MWMINHWVWGFHVDHGSPPLPKSQQPLRPRLSPSKCIASRIPRIPKSWYGCRFSRNLLLKMFFGWPNAIYIYISYISYIYLLWIYGRLSFIPSMDEKHVDLWSCLRQMFIIIPKRVSGWNGPGTVSAKTGTSQSKSGGSFHSSWW